MSARNLLRASQGHLHEQTAGSTPSILYAPEDDGTHGNFLSASYRRILARPAWAARLEKAYTSSRLVPRSHDRRRAELDCAVSSDALLMNIFCYPGMTRRAGICALLGVAPGLRPEFGVRGMLPMARGEVDRTEIDMRLGDLLVEAKLTEGGFGTASRERLLRYEGASTHLELEDLPRGNAGFAGWQLIRGVLAAAHQEARFVVLCDDRRPDLRDAWFRILVAVRSSELRSRLGLVTWQEVAAAAPKSVAGFLASKYGILGR
ncbi:PGN_0703 family putative restriction endonuclease [Bryocella elongata]|uniref:PGN_0703 family putative restriction endonuclease n=1 Tax=Bryocella elongata TaxID=863522 RepID=UPI001F2C2B3E|nr:hypothetical protein [Bryocella elongata]